MIIPLLSVVAVLVLVYFFMPSTFNFLKTKQGFEEDFEDDNKEGFEEDFEEDFKDDNKEGFEEDFEEDFEEE